VCDGTRLVGMVTDRDITIRSTARGQDPKAVKVSDVMSGDVEFCYADASVDEAARMMHEKQLRRMPVKDRNDQFVGIIALSDIATSQAPAETKSKSVEGVSQRR
jgi:CBS domain-containing protein